MCGLVLVFRMEEVTVHRLKSRKLGQISKTASLLHQSLLPPLESFWTLTLVDLEAGPPTQVAGKHSQQIVLVQGGQARKAGSCRVVCEVTGKRLQVWLT